MKNSSSRFAVPTLAVLLLLAVAAHANGGPDVSFYGVIKGQSFIQDNPVAPVLNKHQHNMAGQDSGALFFNVWVELTGSNVVQNASLQIPGGAVTNLLLSPDGMQKRIEVEFESKAELDTMFPNGNYTLTMQGDNDGTKIITLTLTGDAYPSVPRISNYAAAQAVADSSFTLTWDAFPDGTVNDFVEVMVEEVTQFGFETVYHSPNFGEAGALNGTSTSVLVTNLSPGKLYSASLMIARGVDEDTTYGSGVTGITAYTKELEFTMRTTGGSDTNAPQYMGNAPQSNSTFVHRNSGIAFNFNERMDTSIQPGNSITWTGVTPANFTYTWSADGMTLFCLYNTDLPASANISWTLNPNGSPMEFRDLAGLQLASNIGGSFTTGGDTPSSLDVEAVFLVKGRGAFTMNGTPVDSGIFQFSLEAELTGHNTATNGTLSIPGGATLGLTPDEFDGDNMEFDGEYASQADMDRFFPNGTYTVSLNTVHNGAKSVSVGLTGNEYPSFPTIGNFSGTQSVDPSAGFVLSWSGFTGTVAGSANDIIEVEINNQYGQEVYRTPDPGQAGSLDGTATQVTIPANTLAPGRTYEATVRFIKVKHFEQSSATYSGVMVVSVYVSETEFELKTTGQVIQPRLAILPPDSGNFRVRVTGEKGFPYTIEATEDFVNWNFVWFENAWSNINGSEASIDFTDWNSWNLSRRFYRAKEGYGQFGP